MRSFARDVAPWLLMVAVLLILVVGWVLLYFNYAGSVQTGATVQVDRNVVLDKNIIDYSGLLAAGIVVAGAAYRTWKRSVPLLIQEIVHSLRPSPSAGSEKAAGERSRGGDGGLKTVASVVFKEVLLLGRMGECEDFQQWLSHFLTMWGFIGLGITTTLDAIVNNAAVPLPITHPVRLLGNSTGIILIGGLTLSIGRRFSHSDVRSATKRGDWAFLLSLYGTAATGFAVQAFADTANLVGTWVSYPIHLAFLSVLLLSAPWSKFVHALWRPSWVVYSRLSSRNTG